MKPAIALALAAALAGCGTTPQNFPLATGQANPKPAPYQPTPGRPFVALAFSGGGSRAALLAAAVTNQLTTLTYTGADGTAHRVADDIAAVSSVSGGSLYAAYLGIYGVSAPGHSPAEFETFVQNFDGMSYLIGAALNPLTWIGLAAANTTRIAVLENMIAIALGPDGKTPSTATLATIARPGAPTILMNASDMVSGQVFTFDRATMDDLCLSMANVPASVAASASAAFPVAFTPVLLRNNSLAPDGRKIGTPPQDACTRQAVGDWMNNVNSAAGPYTDLEEFRHDVARASLRGVTYANGLPPRRTPVYIRLADGGVVDNLGLTSLRRALLMQGSPIDLTPILAALPAGANAAKLAIVLIEVNSRSDPISPLDTSTQYTSLLDQASADSDALVDSAAGSSGTIFQNFVRELQRSLRASGLADRVALYPMQIDFDRLPDTPSDNPNAGRNLLNRVKSIATSWTLKPGDRDLLDLAAETLLSREPCYAQLHTDLHLTAGPAPAPVPGTTCPTAIPPASAME